MKLVFAIVNDDDSQIVSKALLKAGFYDEIITVTTEQAFSTWKAVARQEGILIGISSGTAVWAAMELTKRPENQGKAIVAFLPDTGERYLSTPMFE